MACFQVYGWGANALHQLGSLSEENHLSPRLLTVSYPSDVIVAN